VNSSGSKRPHETKLVLTLIVVEVNNIGQDGAPIPWVFDRDNFQACGRANSSGIMARPDSESPG
jgi:hypothetical protein